MMQRKPNAGSVMLPCLDQPLVMRYSQQPKHHDTEQSRAETLTIRRTGGCLLQLRFLTHLHCMQVIAKAKVPIIKFKEAVSSLNFDISFNAANGPQAAEYVRDLMQRLPPMRSLILVLKVFLHQRELNEVGFNLIQACPTKARPSSLL